MVYVVLNEFVLQEFSHKSSDLFTGALASTLVLLKLFLSFALINKKIIIKLDF